jgi:hypothetical protein
MAESHGSHHADAWYGHQPSSRRVGSCFLADPLVERRLLFLSLRVHCKLAIDDRSQWMRVVNQVKHMRAELCADCPRKQQAQFLKQAADLILEITTDLNQAGAAHEERANELAGIALDPNFTVPTDPDQGRGFLRDEASSPNSHAAWLCRAKVRCPDQWKHRGTVPI